MSTSSARKQSNLHSFFARKAASKENGSLNAPSDVSPASVVAHASSKSAPSSSSSSSSPPPPPRPPAAVAATAAGAGAGAGAATVPDDSTELDRTSPANDSGEADKELNKRKQAALRELRRTKRRVLLDDDDEDDEEDDDDDDDDDVKRPRKEERSIDASNGLAAAADGAGAESSSDAAAAGAAAAGANKKERSDKKSSANSHLSAAASSDAPATGPTRAGVAAGLGARPSEERGTKVKPEAASSGARGAGATKIQVKKKSATTTTSPSSSSSSAAAAAANKNASDAPPPPTAPAPSTSLAAMEAGSLAKALKVKPDEQLLREARAAWANADGDGGGGRDLPYAVLCHAFGQIEAVTSRLQIQETLTSLFRTCLLLDLDLLPIVYLCCNEVAPAYKCVELGIGDAILVRAISEATGASPAVIKAQYEAQGDLGNVAQSAKGSQKTLGGFFKSRPAKCLTASHVLQVFQQIATTKGNQSQKWKTDCIKKLLVSADGKKEETRYIVRGLQGKLRIGLAESTVLISLAHAVALTVPEAARQPVDAAAAATVNDPDLPEEARSYLDKTLPPEKRLEAAVAILKKAYSEVPSYEVLVKACLEVPLQDLLKVCALTPGIPVAPMLAKPTKSVQEVLKRLNGQKFTCEYKYDGERAQVHLLPDGTTKVFSRNLLDTSEKYPEVPLFVREAAVDVQSFVLDAEVVAFNNKTGQLVPFQVLSTRKKTEESAETAKVQVIVQAFDLMFLNGKSLLSSTLETRRSLLHQHFKAVPGKFQFATSMDHEENGDTTVIEEFLDGAVKGQCEGLMIKTLTANANYEPSRRSLNWLKLKKDYLDGLGDSFDLVPLGAYFGRGKRTGVYGACLLACYDPDTEEFQSVCKIGTGFSDEDLKSLAEKLNHHVTPKKSSQYNTADQLECDVWFDAVQVWEVKAADLSKSSVHRCAEGKLEEGRGIGLRFPRFERVRDDKRPEDATTSDQILEMYYAQDSVADNGDTFDEGI